MKSLVFTAGRTHHQRLRFPATPTVPLCTRGLQRERAEPTSALSLFFSPLALNRDAFELKPRERAGDAIAKPLPILSVSTNLAIKLARARDRECRACKVPVGNLKL